MKTGEVWKLIERLYGAHYNIQLERNALEQEVVKADYGDNAQADRSLARELSDILVKLELALQEYGTAKSIS